MNRECDFLVIGSGVAALSYALQVADKGRVLIVSKATLTETNTRYAQGGIAAVLYSTSDLARHIEDTMVCGSGINDREVVEMVARSAAEAIDNLTSWGVEFDRNKGGDHYALAREGGHSENRILHHKDSTGLEIQNRLAAAVAANPNIEILEHHFAIDLLTQHHLGKLVKKSLPGTECYGAYVLDIATGQVHTFLSKVTVLATGGIGNIYNTTTNPPLATGDGIAMVHRAKGVLRD
ncbi:MAG: FAD-binding protein, partial [Mucinivorans sp.]